MYARAAGLGDRRLLRVLGHLVAARDEVDQHAQVREDDDADDPQRLGEPTQVVAAEDVREHDDQQPDPDEEQEEPEHRQENLSGAEIGRECGHAFSSKWWLEQGEATPTPKGRLPHSG
jgi:hypothetical protein